MKKYFRTKKSEAAKSKMSIIHNAIVLKIQKKRL